MMSRDSCRMVLLADWEIPHDTPGLRMEDLAGYGNPERILLIIIRFLFIIGWYEGCE
jgi:hypothetical protein